VSGLGSWDSDDAQIVSSPDLPDCDVLVLDCEGAEIEILLEMEIRPRVVFVETHGMYYAPEVAIRDKLDCEGYKIDESMVAEKQLRDICEDNGIYVLYSIRR